MLWLLRLRSEWLWLWSVVSLLGGLRLQVLPEDSLPEEHADGEEAGAGGGGGADLKEVVLVQLFKKHHLFKVAFLQGNENRFHLEWSPVWELGLGLVVGGGLGRVGGPLRGVAVRSGGRVPVSWVGVGLLPLLWRGGVPGGGEV